MDIIELFVIFNLFIAIWVIPLAFSTRWINFNYYLFSNTIGRFFNWGFPLHENKFPKTELMSIEEITEKYSGVTCKITFVNNPSVIYNIDEKRVLSYPNTFEIQNGTYQIKPGNRRANVKTYDKLDLNDINQSEEILVYRQKTEPNRWRYIKVEDIDE